MRLTKQKQKRFEEETLRLCLSLCDDNVYRNIVRLVPHSHRLKILKENGFTIDGDGLASPDDIHRKVSRGR